MGAYELDDEAVRKFLDTLHESDAVWPAMSSLAFALKEQLSLPEPKRVGAVVRCTGSVDDGPGIFLRWAGDDHTRAPWMIPGTLATYERADLERIVEILSEGVPYDG